LTSQWETQTAGEAVCGRERESFEQPAGSGDEILERRPKQVIEWIGLAVILVYRWAGDAEDNPVEF
jgi:hypothetical protein